VRPTFAIFLLIPWALTTEIPDVDGHGIEFGNLQLVFEILLMGYFVLYKRSMPISPKRMLLPMSLVVGAIMVSEATTRLIRVPDNVGGNVSLYRLEFFDPEAFDYFLVETATGLCLTAAVFALAARAGKKRGEYLVQ
jgi:hypothetical protein